ncbi:hypothetical protein M2277_001102 [Paenibacillus sp. LBL]|uniref:hypothetical protein n=1 Tax=Paenibacillus sp. LBL TaxID=2940563 RepID=UPI002476B2E6|nr:hypothetical protein [Paenibacillus sp. LBL]MDH6670452.1 hypothetical protein [Paenibacillus sp. LBL]
MKRIIIFTGIPLLLIIIFLFIYQFPEKISVVRTAVAFNDRNPDSLKNTSINIEGTIYRPLFRQHIFKGSIKIRGIEKTENYETLNTEVLKRKNGINMGNLIYNKTHTNPPQHANMLGIIWFDDSFLNISVLGTDMENNQNEAIYIATGGTYEEGISTLRKMRDNYGSGFLNFE